MKPTSIQLDAQIVLTLFQPLLDNLQELVIVTNGADTFKNASILKANKRFELITGLNEKDIINSLVETVILENAPTSNINTLQESYTKRQVTTITLPIEDPCGLMLLVEFHIQPIDYNGTQTHYWLWVGKLIIEQQSSSDDMDLPEKINTIQLLARSSAHDINNMLAVIIGNTDLMLDNVEASSPLYPLLQSISRATAKVVNLTETLLKFTAKN